MFTNRVLTSSRFYVDYVNFALLHKSYMCYIDMESNVLQKIKWNYISLGGIA